MAHEPLVFERYQPTYRRLGSGKEVAIRRRRLRTDSVGPETVAALALTFRATRDRDGMICTD